VPLIGDSDGFLSSVCSAIGFKHDESISLEFLEPLAAMPFASELIHSPRQDYIGNRRVRCTDGQYYVRNTADILIQHIESPFLFVFIEYRKSTNFSRKFGLA
jgi:hypothetical protein